MNLITFILSLLLASAAIAADGPEPIGPEPDPRATTEGPEPTTPTTPTTLGTPAPRSDGLRITLDKPGEREFIRDLAGLIDEGDELTIRQRLDKLLTDTATPVIIVTIDSMAKHGGAGLRIETFARLLFDQWGIGHAKVNSRAWNTGILLLVSKDDRKARIELGAGWARDKDELAQKIMDEQIIPHFKAGAFSKGIAQGVEALDAMGRSKPLPEAQKPPKTAWQSMVTIGMVALAIFTVVSMIRRGNKGWAWIFWGIALSVIGSIIFSALTQGRGGRGGGSFGGGSFGGGFSGGGGASGSW